MGKIYPLYSGSKGNCTYISGENEGVLIDVGVSFKKVKEALTSRAISTDSVKAIFITHEHSDHISGLRVTAKNLGVPIYASEITAQTLNKLNPELNVLPIENEMDLGGLKIVRFNTSHDCLGSSGYKVILQDGNSASVCTDTGCITDEIMENITGSTVLMLESNHCVTMLSRGPYPPELKVRILSEKGHLSNAECAQTLTKLYQTGTKRFILAHLSENNNSPLVAESTTKSVFMDNRLKAGSDYILYIANPAANEIMYF